MWIPYLSVCRSVCLSVCRSVCLSVCRSVCLLVTVNKIRNEHILLHLLLLSSHITLCVNKLVCVLVTSFVNFVISA